MKRLIATFLFFINSLVCISQIWSAPQGIREIAVPNLPDIAIASMDLGGPVIYFNPRICEQLGPHTTAFFQAHEYGHHVLGHVIQKLVSGNNPYVQAWLSMTAENEADAYALQYWLKQGNKEVVQAWVNAMWNLNNSGDQSHPPSRVRANNVALLYQRFTGKPLF